jgi:hypothetical protein
VINALHSLIAEPSCHPTTKGKIISGCDNARLSGHHH